METTTICRLCMVVLLVVLPGYCAPRSKNAYKNIPQTVYDQKQTGDYNIQLHLKDFQIIALLGDDLGDYDYNYDYSDFTLKPSSQNPSTEASPSTQKPSTEASTLQPSDAASNSTQLSSELLDKETDNSTDDAKKLPSNATEAVAEIVESSTVKQAEIPEETNSPGKIKVQIIETPVGVVPGEVQYGVGGAHHGETTQTRRCAHGFTRDKKGRCRRMRRPGTTSQLPYGIGRIANNLAARFRYSSPEDSIPLSRTSED